MLRAAFTSALHRPALQASHSKTALALAVSGRDVPTRGAPLRRVRSRDLLDPADRLVLQTPQNLAPTTSADRAVQPTFLSDSNTRLLGGAMRRASHRPHVRNYLHPDHVEPPRDVSGGFLTQSLRRSLSRAFSFAIARFVFSRRLDPHLQRASRCCNTLNRFDSPRRRPGAYSSSPVDSAADTTTPRSMPTTLASPGPQIELGMCANATCQRPARSRVTR